MEAYKVLFYLLFISLHLTAALADCTTSYCNQSSTGVRFPFRLTDKQARTCGSAGFDLNCAFPDTLLINLPNSGDFFVRSISYRSQTIQLYDPLNCLPARLLAFDLANSPFSTSYYRDFTLLSCPSDARLMFGYLPVDCLSNSSFSTFAIDSTTFMPSMTGNQSGCVIKGRLSVPVDQPYYYGLTSQLKADIILSWSTPNCKKCERVGDSCGYAKSNTNITTCFSDIGDAPSPSSLSSIFRIIAFAIIIPTMAGSIAFACFKCSKDVNNRTTINTVTPEDTIAPPNVVGLDQATIDSYTKVVLGESKRLPGHDDATCPICLSEYHVDDTVRCIPECRHCFHAECIDEWLKMNVTCPVCRNSPSHV